ncbi:MAG: hypothetical protein BWY62_00560 [Firmicutes bacterium ADurb.Bin356]|nr:MAG: hypothetical protein BWY62_00560 [Firmicutes bacterium ADurb.Bin356]
MQPQVQAQPALENAPEEAAKIHEEAAEAEEEAVKEEAIEEAALSEAPASVSEEEDASLNDEEDYFARRQSDFLLGRIVSKDILDEDGTILIKSGTTITASVFKRAKKANKLTELSLNAFNQTLIRR